MENNINYQSNEEGKMGIEVIDVKSENNDEFIKYIKNDYLEKNITWTRSDEIVVRKYIIKAIEYRILYNESYFRYIFYYKLLLWPLIIATCISIASQMISATLITGNIVGNKSGILSIITTSFSIFVTILTYLQSKTSYYRLAKGCKKASNEFTNFADQLENILAISRDQRENPLLVINIIQSDFNKLLRLYSEYEIPSYILRSYIKKNKDSQILADLSTNVSNKMRIFHGVIERDLIIDKFLESLLNIRGDNDKMSKQKEQIIDI